MAGTGDDRASGAGDGGHLRAAHADREHVIGVLKTAFVRGMLDKDEFDQRVTRTFASRTYAELAAVTVDLPAGLPAAGPLPVPKPADEQDEGWLTVKRAVIISACLVLPTVLGIAIGLALSDPHRYTALYFISLVAFFLATLVSVPLIAEARHRQRSRTRLPQAPASGAGGQLAGESRTRRQRRSPGRDLTLAVTA